MQGGVLACPRNRPGIQSPAVSHKILVVDDEPAITELLEYNLQRNGYVVVVAHDGREALRLARADHPDLIVLDLMLPELDGLEVCRELRRESSVPIIMLTARDGEVDRVVGLELGADDYVTKPFSVRELIARVKAVLRRVAAGDRDSASTLRAGPLVIDTLSHEARIGDSSLSLTRLEFDLLEMLARHPGQTLTGSNSWIRYGATTTTVTLAQSTAPSSVCGRSCSRPAGQRAL